MGIACCQTVDNEKKTIKTKKDNNIIKLDNQKQESIISKKSNKTNKKHNNSNIQESNISKKSDKTNKKPNSSNIQESKISKKSDKKEVILNKKSKEETNILLESLYNSYYAAKTYFNKNEFKEKEVDAIHCLKKIIEAKELLEKGKHKEINLAELPKKINSEYITGYTPEERKKKITEIITKLKEEEKQTRKILNQKMEEVKKILIRTKNKDMDKYRPYLDEEKNHLTLISKEIKTIEKTLIDDYIPVPSFIYEQKPYKKERVNNDIEENAMEIKVSGLTYTKSNPVVYLGIRGEKFNVSKEIKGTNQNDIYCAFTWDFSDEQFKNLIKYKIEIALGRTYAIKSMKVKGKGELPLRNLRSSSSMYESVKLKMESGKPDTSIDIEINLRSPIIEKEYDDDYRDIIKITKIYPKFNFDG